MSLALEERITQHEAYVNVDRILQALEEFEMIDLSTEEIQMIERLNSTIIFLKESLDKVEPYLVSTNTLKSMNNPLVNIQNEFRNYINNGNIQHLRNSLSYVESLLPYYPQILVTKTPEEIEGVRTAVVRFRQSVGQYLSYVEREANETTESLSKNRNKLTELTTSIENQKGRIDTIINDFQKQFLENQTQRNEAFHDFKTSIEKDFTGSMKSFEKGFEQFLTDQQESVESLKDSFNEVFVIQNNAYDDLIAELKEKVKTELDQINTMNKEAEKIVGIISMKGLAHGYQKIANDEGKKAFWWNIGSLISMAILGWFGYQYIINHEGSMAWTDLISRLILTGIGITLFTYCAKQAANHRTEERRNRKIELELASLDPYLKDLEEEKQKEVKRELVNKYFGVELLVDSTQQQQAPITQPQQQVLDAISSNPQLLQLLSQHMTQK
jgi:hypothetical protein